MAKYKVKYRVVEVGNPKKILLAPTQSVVEAASETNAINEVKKKQAAFMKARKGELDILSVELA